MSSVSSLHTSHSSSFLFQGVQTAREIHEQLESESVQGIDFAFFNREEKEVCRHVTKISELQKWELKQRRTVAVAAAAAAVTTTTRTAKKQKVLIGKTTTLHVHHAFLYIS